MTLDDLRRAAELLPPMATIALPAGELAAAFAAGSGARAESPAPAKDETDRWLCADDVARILGVSRRYVYAHRDSYPFAKKLDGGTVRFSEKGLRRWMERQK